ncbi:MAG: hypothetical protein WC942_01550 [Clostridia bacterium]
MSRYKYAAKQTQTARNYVQCYCFPVTYNTKSVVAQKVSDVEDSLESDVEDSLESVLDILDLIEDFSSQVAEEISVLGRRVAELKRLI